MNAKTENDFRQDALTEIVSHATMKETDGEASLFPEQRRAERKGTSHVSVVFA
jgi:hypothetical protein